VEAFIRCVLRLVETEAAWSVPNHTVNVGAGTRTSIARLARIVLEETESRSPVEVVPYESRFPCAHDVQRRVPVEWKLPAWFDTFAGLIFVLLLILPAIGFGIAWVQKFPRWSYPYTGMAFVMALYIANVTTPGLNILGYPIFGSEPWGWRACIPLGTAFVAARAISHSFEPLGKLFTNLWEDWSILSYLMVGVLPLVIAFQFDEIDRLYSLYFMVPFAVSLVGMVLLYLRSKSTQQGVLVLTIGVLAIIFPSVWGSNSYWLHHNGMNLSGASRMLIAAGKIAIIMLLPAWLELLRQFAIPLRRT
jgi:hypothetical protein